MSPSPFDSATLLDTSYAAMESSQPRINKFDGTNFHAWKLKMQMVLEERDRWEVVSAEVKAEKCTSALDQATYMRKSRKAMAIILMEGESESEED